jgi:hypothetical protein
MMPALCEKLVLLTIRREAIRRHSTFQEWFWEGFFGGEKNFGEVQRFFDNKHEIFGSPETIKRFTPIASILTEIAGKDLEAREFLAGQKGLVAR